MNNKKPLLIVLLQNVYIQCDSEEDTHTYKPQDLSDTYIHDHNGVEFLTAGQEFQDTFFIMKMTWNLISIYWYIHEESSKCKLSHIKEE